jgi:hypothetical protein
MLNSTDALLPARRPRVHALQLRVQLECGIQELDMSKKTKKKTKKLVFAKIGAAFLSVSGILYRQQ